MKAVKIRKKGKDKIMDYDDAPSGYVTLYNYKEPFMPFEEGFGFQGTLLFDGEKDTIQCHFCGEWFTALQNHIAKEHAMKPSDYKKMVGLRKSTALIGDKTREKFIQMGHRNKGNLVPGGKHSEESKKKISEGLKRSHNQREHQNEWGTCPAQLLERIMKIADKHGRAPTYREISFKKTVEKTYGTLDEAFRLAGVYAKYGKRKSGQNVNYRASEATRDSRSDEYLLEMLRKFFVENGREPSTSDCRRGLLPKNGLYQSRFGSLMNAKIKALGVENLQRFHLYKGKYYTIEEIAKMSGIPKSTIYCRTRKDMTVTEAVALGKPKKTGKAGKRSTASQNFASWQRNYKAQLKRAETLRKKKKAKV